MAVKFTNNAKTTLASSLTNVATSASVVDGSVFPTLGAGEYFYCTFDDGSNNEIVKVTARSGNTLTIVRGVDNTSARAFSSGDSAELRATAGLLTDIQENIAAKSANQTVYSATTASSATSYDIGINPGVEANASVFLNGVYQHHNTFSFSGSTLTFDAAPPNGMALEVLVDNLVNLQSSNLTVDTFTAADVGGNPQTDFTLSDAPAAEDNLLVFIDGVFQDQDAYTISNQTLTITDGVTADFGVTVYVINPVNIGTPSDGTVTSSKLSGNITMPADLTVTGDVAFDSPTFVVDNANSRVGIGTASPSTLLDIVGDVKMSANLTVDTSTLVVDATNNRVGIGNSSPSAGLHVETDVNPVLKLDRGSANNTNANLYYNGTLTGQLSAANAEFQISAAGSSTPTTFFTNGSERMRIDASGKLQLGTTSSSQTIFQFLSATNGANTIHFGDGASADAYRGYINYNHTGDRMEFATSGSERMRIDSSGAVGIGQVPETARWSGHDILQVGGRATFLGNDTVTATGQTALLDNLYYDASGNFQHRGDSRGVAMQFVEGQVIFSNSNQTTGTPTVSERMRIDSNGNIAIGGTSASNFSGYVTLDLRDTTGGLIDFSEASAGVYARIQAVVNNSLNIFNRQAYPLILGTNDTERMRIASNGRTSIGTTSTNAGLHVANADIRCSGAAIANDANSISMSQESVGGVITCRGPSTSTRGSLYLSVNQSNGGGGRVGFKIDNLGLIYAEYMGSGGATTDVNYNTSTGEIYQVTSSQRYKENISEYTDSILEKVNNLTVKNFDYKEGGYTNQIGLIAEEVEEQIPYLVNKKEIEGYDEPQPDSVKYSQLSVFLLKAIQEQQEQIETLKQEIREIREGG